MLILHTRIPRLLAGLSGALFGSLALAQPIWVAPWSGSQVPAANSTWNSTAVFSPDGELVLATTRVGDIQMLRVGAAGALRWDRSISNFALPATVIPQADGSALFGSAQDGDSYVGKVGADGHLAWLSKQAADPDIVATGPDRAVAVSCVRSTTSRMVVAMLDTTSGTTLWQNDIAFAGSDCSMPAVSDGLGNAYVRFNGHLLKYTSSGNLAWNVVGTGSSSYLLGASTDFLYIETDAGVQARRTTDGSVAWTSPIHLGALYNPKPARWLVAGGELIANTAGAVVRLDNATGAPRWSTALDATVALAPTLIDGRVVAATTSGGLNIVRLDMASGAPLSTPVANSVVVNNVLAIGRLGSNGIGMLARNGDDAAAATPRLYRIDATSGTALAALDLPVTPIAVASWSVADGGADLISAGEVVHVDGRRMVVRSVRASDGVTLWQTNTAFGTTWFFNSPPQVAVTPELAVMSAASGDSNYEPYYGIAFVQAFDRVSGAARWTATFWSFGQQNPYISAPQVDTAGDIYVALGVNLPCFGSQLCMRQSLVKLAAKDGHIIWQRDVDAGWDVLQPFPYSFIIVGNDIVGSGSFDSPADASRLVGLSRSTGAPLWHTASLDPNGPAVWAPIDASHFLASYQHQTSRIATGSGTVEWSVTPPGCASPCYGYDSTTLPSGDRIGVGEAARRATVTRLHSDGSSFDGWTQTVPDADMRTYITSTKTDTSGNLWLRLGQRWSYDGNGLQILARFDPISMSLLGQQVVSHQLIDSSQDFSIGTIEQMPVGKALVESWGNNGAAEALLNLHVDADGDISVTVTADRRSVGVGGKVSFHAIVHYTGSAPITGAHLDLTFPAHQGLTDSGCVGQGVSQCVVDTSTSNLHATFDLPADGTADIHGSFKPLPGFESSHTGVQASVRGPIGLRENDTLNNMARAPVVISLFADGFQ